MAVDHRVRARVHTAAARILSEVSAVDLSRSVERDNNAFCRQGFGTLMAKLAAGLPAPAGDAGDADRMGTARASRSQTTKGQIQARAVIVTVSTNVLTAGKIKFTPELPKRHLDAAGKLKLGSYDHVALELTGNPLGLRADELVFEKSESKQTARDLRQRVRLDAVHGRRRRQASAAISPPRARRR